ncbi:MAG: dicarboxylate/amino acid:cation symporter [Synergistaceae bacterium]|nr:dicarboxylate/amino acid:cation symporter [Synergistaceae bacterium]
MSNNDTDSALSLSLEYIRRQLAALRLTPKDINRAELMCEESLVTLLKHADFSGTGAFTVNISKFFGNVSIKLTVPGQEFAFSDGLGDVLPLDSEDISPEAAESIRNMLLRSFGQNLRYRHSGKYNIITVRAVRSAYSGLYAVLGAMACSGICALLMKAYLPESIYMSVNDSVFVPVRGLFMNGLKLCAVSAVFLSIALCMADTGSMSGIKRTGGKILGCFLMTQVFSLMIGFGLMLAFRVGEGAGLTVPSSGNAQAVSVSVLDTLVNVIPSDMVSPFLHGNMLQLIALAVILGVCAGLSGAKSVTHLFTELNGIFTKAMGLFLKMVPAVVFCSIASLILTIGAGNLLSVLGILLLLAAGDMLLFLLYWLMVKFLAGLSPAVMYKKSIPALITAVSTCSSIAALPDSMRCAKNMGIPPHVYSFSLPLGITVSKNISLIWIVAGVMFTANIYGRVLTFGDMVFLGITALILVTGSANMPGGGAVVMPVILMHMGIPADTVPLFLMIGVMLDMLDTSTICMMPLTAALVVSAREGVLDVKEYERP